MDFWKEILRFEDIKEFDNIDEDLDQFINIGTTTATSDFDNTVKDYTIIKDTLVLLFMYEISYGSLIDRTSINIEIKNDFHPYTYRSSGFADLRQLTEEYTENINKLLIYNTITATNGKDTVSLDYHNIMLGGQTFFRSENQDTEYNRINGIDVTNYNYPMTWYTCLNGNTKTYLFFVPSIFKLLDKKYIVLLKLQCKKNIGIIFSSVCFEITNIVINRHYEITYKEQIPSEKTNKYRYDRINYKEIFLQGKTEYTIKMNSKTSTNVFKSTLDTKFKLSEIHFKSDETDYYIETDIGDFNSSSLNSQLSKFFKLPMYGNIFIAIHEDNSLEVIPDKSQLTIYFKYFLQIDKDDKRSVELSVICVDDKFIDIQPSYDYYRAYLANINILISNSNITLYDSENSADIIIEQGKLFNTNKIRNSDSYMFSYKIGNVFWFIIPAIFMYKKDIDKYYLDILRIEYKSDKTFEYNVLSYEIKHIDYVKKAFSLDIEVNLDDLSDDLSKPDDTY
jgi:hypothetical protein